MLLGLSCALPGASLAAETTVAVAANFVEPMRLIVDTFTDRSGHVVRMSVGSSGKLYAQIRNGAPYDAFFSADDDKPALLEEAGLTVAGSRFTYVYGALVVWTRVPGLTLDGPATLANADFSHLALANPRLAPYGAAAVEALEALALVEHTQSKWVIGENISQSFQFVSTGNAQFGFVAASQVFRDGRLQSGSGWRVPQGLHQPIRQDAVLLERGENNVASKDLLAFIASDEGQTILERYGYATARPAELAQRQEMH